MAFNSLISISCISFICYAPCQWMLWILWGLANCWWYFGRVINLTRLVTSVFICLFFSIVVWWVNTCLHSEADIKPAFWWYHSSQWSCFKVVWLTSSISNVLNDKASYIASGVLFTLLSMQPCTFLPMIPRTSLRGLFGLICFEEYIGLAGYNLLNKGKMAGLISSLCICCVSLLSFFLLMGFRSWTARTSTLMFWQYVWSLFFLFEGGLHFWIMRSDTMQAFVLGIGFLAHRHDPLLSFRRVCNRSSSEYIHCKKWSC